MIITNIINEDNSIDEEIESQSSSKSEKEVEENT